jgi:predicted RNase H-like HicB family nuclease
MEVAVVYHQEGDTWWAESDDAPGFFAAADTLPELRGLVWSGLPFHFGETTHVDICEVHDWGGAVVVTPGLDQQQLLGTPWLGASSFRDGGQALPEDSATGSSGGKMLTLVTK